MSEEDSLEPPPPIKRARGPMVEQAPASEWPEAWIMPEGECENQKAPNKMEPNVHVTVEELQDLGIWYVR